MGSIDMSRRNPVRLAILECDTPLPETKEKYGGYGGVFKKLIYDGARAEGYKDPESVLPITTHQIEQDPDNYPNPDDIDAILLTGSKHDSFADTPWIKKLVDFTADVLKQKRIRVIGVCFGHQIVARALGLKVGRNPEGWEAAVHDVQLTALGKELLGLETLRIHQMHRDMVFGLPEGAKSLGSSPVCENQGMYVPNHFIAFQGHPEFNAQIMSEIVETRHATGIFDEKAYQEHVKKVKLPHDGLIIGAAFVRFLFQE